VAQGFLHALPAKTEPHGETYPETVLFRLITERGRPSVKIGASEQVAGDQPRRPELFDLPHLTWLLERTTSCARAIRWSRWKRGNSCDARCEA